MYEGLFWDDNEGSFGREYHSNFIDSDGDGITDDKETEEPYDNPSPQKWKWSARNITDSDGDNTPDYLVLESNIEDLDGDRLMISRYNMKPSMPPVWLA